MTARTTGRVLLVEDDPGLGTALAAVLREVGHDVVLCDRGDDAIGRAEDGGFDVVVTDVRLPGAGGLEVVRRLHASRPRLPVLVMTAHGTTATAIEATKSGALDYLVKPFGMDELITAVGGAIARGVAKPELVPRDDLGGGEELVGTGRAMQAVYLEIGRLAPLPVTVLIRGETGTGKELVARALHRHGTRSVGPFVAMNCAAIPEGLLESELFGHERGAFTGAVDRRRGRFEEASGGTLFLDEIGELGSSLQAKLLRVLQDREIRRLGGREAVRVDVRVIAATHVDLEAGIAAGRFREDLYYRLNQSTLVLPALRERREDIGMLAIHFLHRHARDLGLATPGLDRGALLRLEAHDWPGNVRELENVLRSALIGAHGFAITATDISRALEDGRAAPSPGADLCGRWVGQILDAAISGQIRGAHATCVAEMERQLFSQAIRLANGNQVRASRWLGVSRVTLREKLRHFGLKPGPEGPDTPPREESRPPGGNPLSTRGESG